MTWRGAHRLGFVASLVVLLSGLHGVALGATRREGGRHPTVAVDRAELAVGERVLVTVDGWTSRVVTLSVCGNLANRGSVDCNMVASEGLGLDRDGSATVTDFVVMAPPAPCPCVVRASSATYDEVAVAPITLRDHPVGPVVGSGDVEPVEVSVEAAPRPRGVLAAVRSALGGPTPYEVTVSVRNRSAETLPSVDLAGAVRRRSGDDLTDLELPSPGPLEPGEIWEGTALAVVPAPAFGNLVFEVTASGAGRSVLAERSARRVPLALVVVLLVLLVDVAAIVARRLARRRAEGSLSAGRASVDGPSPVASAS